MSWLLSFLMSVIVHHVDSTKLISNGKLTISTTVADAQTVNVNIDYALHMSMWAPVPDQKGTLHQSLPIAFVTEQGYLDLERAHTMEYKDTTLTHMGRANKDGFSNCHVIHVVKHDHTWQATAYYHPTVSSTGWVALDITYNNIPGLGNYTIHTHLQRSVDLEESPEINDTL